MAIKDKEIPTPQPPPVFLYFPWLYILGKKGMAKRLNIS